MELKNKVNYSSSFTNVSRKRKKEITTTKREKLERTWKLHFFETNHSNMLNYDNKRDNLPSRYWHPWTTPFITTNEKCSRWYTNLTYSSLISTMVITYEVFFTSGLVPGSKTKWEVKCSSYLINIVMLSQIFVLRHAIRLSKLLSIALIQSNNNHQNLP